MIGDIGSDLLLETPGLAVIYFVMIRCQDRMPRPAPPETAVREAAVRAHAGLGVRLHEAIRKNQGRT